MFESTIITTCKEEFSYKLANEIEKALFQAGDTNALFIQTKEAPREAVEELVNKYMRVDGQYTFNGVFMKREEVFEKLKDFCKTVNISIVPKVKKYPLEPEESLKKRFGYIEYIEIKPIWENKL